MLTVHHLNNSRSQRILWLLEELGLEYQLKTYQRDPVTNLAPPELELVHPLGKSPVLTDDAITVIESGAIIDYILRHYGAGRLQPEVGSDGHEQYLQWLHYAEGSAMLPMMLKMYTARQGDAGAPAAIQQKLREVVAPAHLPNGLTAGVQFVFPDMANFGWDSVLGRFG